VMPPKTSYALTPIGVELDGVVQAIDRWARTHLAPNDQRAQRARPARPATSAPRKAAARLSGVRS